MDFDSQQSSTCWLSLRPKELNSVHVQPGYRPNQLNQTRSWQLRAPTESDLIIMDTPAAMPEFALEEVISYSDVILVPVLPSMIDIKAVEQFIYQLLQTRAYRQNPIPVGVIANRVRQNTKIFGTLNQFLNTLELPVVSVIRDTQQFVKAYERGIGITDLIRMSPSDRRSIHLITSWIDNHLSSQIATDDQQSDIPSASCPAERTNESRREVKELSKDRDDPIEDTLPDAGKSPLSNNALVMT